MDDPREPRVSRVAYLAALVLAAVFFALFFSYVFKSTPPFMELDPARNPHFAIAVLFLEKLSFLFGSAVSSFILISLRLENLAYLLGAAAIAFASLSVGLVILNRIGYSELPRAEKGPFAFALGVGVFALLTLGLGLAGLLTPWAFIPLVLVTGAFGAKRGAEFVRRLRNPGELWGASERVFVALAIVAGAVIVVYSLIPPMEFDALEYHVGAPAKYFAEGRISYATYNVYSNFPSNSEMLYLMSMALSGSKLYGAILGNVLNAYIAIAACIAVYGLGTYLSCPKAGAFAAAALITSMGFFAVSTGVYVEPLQILYTVLAVLAVSKFIQGANRGALVAGAIATGLAMGVKYPAAVLVAVPLAASTLLVKDSIAARVRAFAIFSTVSMLVVAPWLVKNVIFTGNPVYPLVYKFLGGRDWSHLQDARWAFAHTPKGGLAFEQWARHIFSLFFSRLDITVLSFIFIPFALAVRPLSRRMVFACAFGFLYVFLWFALTHRIERFAVPAFAILGAVSGAGFAAIPQGATRRFANVACVLVACANIFFMAGSYGQVLEDISIPLSGRYGPFLRVNKEGYDAWAKVNETIPPSSKVLLYAEAETFYLDVNYSASTVFDRQPLDELSRKVDGDPARLPEAVKAAGFDFIFVNWKTWQRQQDTYTIVGLSGVAVDQEPVPIPSYLLTPSTFKAMLAAGGIDLVFSCGPQVYPDVPAYALYRVR